VSTDRRDSAPESAAGGTATRAASIEHGLALAASAFLAGLAPFAVLVWLPASTHSGVGRGEIRSFGVLAWGLLLALALAGAGELSSYAVRASGDPLSGELFWQTLFDSRVGAVWLTRLGLALLAAAAVWMGGLLGFAVALGSRAYRGLAPDSRTKLRERSVRRFSVVATFAVVLLACTGLYAAVLHITNPQALLATPYGSALIVKLIMVSLLLAVGASNLLLHGRGPFGRLVILELLLALGLFVATGFLTSLPPASGA
jgi:copper transport protein